MTHPVRYFGIRHHGPGSAHALMQALDALDPAAVLIEGPPEGEEIVHAVASSDLVPPVALLCYAADNPANASFYPFVEYSPEWQAISWALKRGRPVRFIDLPAANTLAMNADDIADHGGRDPLGELAAADGQSDGETWWNGTVEQAPGQHDYFDAVTEAMTALREGEGELPRREAMREAQMRLSIADAQSKIDGPLAVVVGAWHVPALTKPSKAKDDRALLKGAEKIKVATAWVPWTDIKLASRSGYGAGVSAPGWYSHLWEHYATATDGAPSPRDIAIGWVTKAAEVLRDDGHMTSTASVIETVRLVEAIASIRTRPMPGLDDFDDAMLSVLCGGNPAHLAIIAKKLAIGNRIGAVGEGLPQTPLQADLARQQRVLKLKPTAYDEPLSLDLRSETGLAKSTLLHRLNMLGVPWGTPAETGKGRNTFRENWTLKWGPELSVMLAEASIHGGTVREASANKAQATIDRESTPEKLAVLVGDCLKGDLPEAYEAAVTRLQVVSKLGGALTELMAAVPPLASVLRYGTARRFDKASLRLLVTTLCLDIHVNLPYASRSLDGEASEAMRTTLSSYAQAVAILDDEFVRESWTRVLNDMAEDLSVAPSVRGFATRQVHSEGDDRTAGRLSRALSPGLPPAEASAWLEGFLSEGAEILVVDMSLLKIVDAWLIGLEEEDFIATLPMLRRSLSGFEKRQRTEILDAVARDCKPAASGLSGEVSPIFGEALPLLMTILGPTTERQAA